MIDKNKKYIELKLQVIKYNIVRLGEKLPETSVNGVFNNRLFLKEIGSGYSSLNKFLKDMILDEKGNEISYTIKRICKVLKCNKVDLLQIKLYDEVKNG